MSDICGRIIAEQSIAGIEGEVATLDEVFGLLRYGELAAAEERYLPQQNGNGHAKA